MTLLSPTFQLRTVVFRGVNGNLRRGQRKDQPASSRVD